MEENNLILVDKEKEDEKNDIEKEKHKINKKIVGLSVNIILVIASIILIFLFVASLLYTAYFKNSRINEYNEGLYYEKDNIIFNLIFVSIFIFIILLINKVFLKKSKKMLNIISIIVVGILSLAWVNFVQAQVKWDQEMVLECAKNFSKNSFNLLDGKGYFYMHPLQLGCVLGMELIIRIIRNSTCIVMQYTNIVFLLGTIYLLTKITKYIYKSEITNRILNFLLIGFLVIPLFNVVVYGNIYGLFFSILAIFFLFRYYENKKIIDMFLIPIFLSISIVFKSNYEIVMIAIIISLILDLINKFNIKSIISIFLIIVCFSLSYPIVYKIVEHRSGREVNEGIPMITYIAMSIQPPMTHNSGWYHDTKTVETIYPGNNFDKQATIDESKEIITERLEEFYNNPKVAQEFYLDKIASTWLEPAYQTLWWSEPANAYDSFPEEYINYISNNKVLLSILHGKLHVILLKYLDIVEIMVFSMSLVSIFYGIKNRKMNYQNIILILIFIGGFLFHIIWETKCIYVIPYYIMLLPSASNGIETIRKKYLEISKKITNHRPNC